MERTEVEAGVCLVCRHRAIHVNGEWFCDHKADPATSEES